MQAKALLFSEPELNKKKKALFEVTSISARFLLSSEGDFRGHVNVLLAQSYENEPYQH
jgi:hypothetical protein